MKIKFVHCSFQLNIKQKNKVHIFFDLVKKKIKMSQIIRVSTNKLKISSISTLINIK